MKRWAAPNTPYQRVVDAFGGAMNVHREVVDNNGKNVGRSEVYRWLYDCNGLVPARWQGPVMRAAERLRLKLRKEDLVG